MDLNQRLHDLGAEKRHEALSDREQMERMKKAVQSKISHRMVNKRWMPMPVVLSLLLTCFGMWFFLPSIHLDQKQLPSSTEAPTSEVSRLDTESPTLEKSKFLVLDQRFSFASDFVKWMQRYTDYEIKQVTDSPFANVFQSTDQAVLLETNKGTVHVVFFPNSGEAERVEIDEDFTVRGQITFTFTGTKLNEGAAPLHATGPTYQYSHNNLLILSSNSDFVTTFRSRFAEFDTYRSIFENFELNFSEYTYLNDLKLKKIKVTPEEIKQKPERAIFRLRSSWWANPRLKDNPFIPKVGDRTPGLFVRTGTYDDVLSIYAAADGTHHLFRLSWDHENWMWAPVEHKQKPGKTKQISS